MSGKTAQQSLVVALRARAGAIARANRAEARLAIVEAVLVDVWKWTNDGHPHLELLLPVLRRAEAEYEVLAALEELETNLPGGTR